MSNFKNQLHKNDPNASQKLICLDVTFQYK